MEQQPQPTERPSVITATLSVQEANALVALLGPLYAIQVDDQRGAAQIVRFDARSREMWPLEVN